MNLGELARRLGCRLEGDASLEVTRVAGIEDAGPGDITFLSNSKYASKLTATQASAVIADDRVREAPCAVLRTAEVYLAFAEAVTILTPPQRPAPGISPLASIDPSATLGRDVYAGPFVVVGPQAHIGDRTALHPHAVVGRAASIGDDCDIHAGVSIREGVVVGSRVVLQDGVVLGGDGFGFARRRDGTHRKVPQVGRVVVEDDVEIGANTTVDRPAVGETRIGAGAKLDNLVMIAHGVKVGRNALLAAQVGVAGSTVLEDDVVMAGQSGATGHIRLGRGAIVGAKSAVTKDIAAGAHVTGIPAGDVADWREATVLLRRLPELRRTLSDLVERLAVLEARLNKPV